MGHDYIRSLISQNEDIAFLNNVSSDRMDKPVLVSNIFNIISDNGHYVQHIGEDKTLSLFRLAKEYFNSCWGMYLESMMGGVGLEKLIQYSESIVYHVLAPDGERVATEKEVSNGVEQLIVINNNAFEQDVKEHLYLLMWTFNGQLRYYKKAGLEYNYVDGVLADTPIQLIFRAGQKLRDMLDWINQSGNYERSIATLKAIKKRGKYKYPAFAKDEIHCEISTKQIQYLCKKSIVRDGATDTQRQAKRLLFRVEKSKYKLLPHDIALMRCAYTEIRNGITVDTLSMLSDEVVSLCKLLKSARDQGMLTYNAFALKIVKSVEERGVCSDKQYAVLKKSADDINWTLAPGGTQSNETNTKKESDSDDRGGLNVESQELLNMSDALGSGVLGVM